MGWDWVWNDPLQGLRGPQSDMSLSKLWEIVKDRQPGVVQFMESDVIEQQSETHHLSPASPPPSYFLSKWDWRFSSGRVKGQEHGDT